MNVLGECFSECFGLQEEKEPFSSSKEVSTLKVSALQVFGDGTTYNIGERISKGAFGAVYKITCVEESKEYVLKKTHSKYKVDKVHQNALKSLGNEAVMLAELNEKDPEKKIEIIRLKEIINVNGDPSLVLDIGGEELYFFIQKKGARSLFFTEKIAKQMLEVLAFLWEHGVAHGDFKLENVLWDGRRIKVIDFGSAFKGEITKATYEGTYVYSAPEVALDLMIGKAADIWALGCALFIVYTGTVVFATSAGSGNDWTKLIRVHEMRLQKNYPSPLVSKSKHYKRSRIDSRVPSLEKMVERSQEIHGDRRGEALAFWDLMDKMLTFDPNERINPTEALERLSRIESQNFDVLV